MPRRPERVAEQIKEEVSLIISGDLQDPRLIKPRTTPVQTWESFNGFRLSQKSKGMFSVVVADLAEFIQDAAFLIFIRLMVTVIDGFEVLHT